MHIHYYLSIKFFLKCFFSIRGVLYVLEGYVGSFPYRGLVLRGPRYFSASTFEGLEKFPGNFKKDPRGA